MTTGDVRLGMPLMGKIRGEFRMGRLFLNGATYIVLTTGKLGHLHVSALGETFFDVDKPIGGFPEVSIK